MTFSISPCTLIVLPLGPSLATLSSVTTTDLFTAANDAVFSARGASEYAVRRLGDEQVVARATLRGPRGRVKLVSPAGTEQRVVPFGAAREVLRPAVAGDRLGREIEQLRVRYR